MSLNKRQKRGEKKTWTSKRIRNLSTKLSKMYHDPNHYNKADPLDEIIFIILSSKTQEDTYVEAYESIKREFPNWCSYLNKRPAYIEKLIRSGGLARKKERWIRQILTKIVDIDGKTELTFLAQMSTAEAEEYLTALPGIGLKSARCVLMYSLNREVFPVDSHCNRILSRLGIISYRRLTDAIQNEIQEKIPSNIRYSLHVNLVAHGRSTCKATNPPCDDCQISNYCTYPKNSYRHS